ATSPASAAMNTTLRKMVIGKLRSLASVAGKAHGMTIVVRGIVHCVHMGKAREADDEDAEQAGEGKLHDARLRGGGCRDRSGSGGHGNILSPSTRGPFVP